MPGEPSHLPVCVQAGKTHCSDTIGKTGWFDYCAHCRDLGRYSVCESFTS